MKHTVLISALILTASIGMASATECTRLGNSNNFRCDTGDRAFTVKNAADANAAAKAIQGQLQGQNQSQSSDNRNTNTNVNGNKNSNKNSNLNANHNNNSNSSSISNVIEGNPAHTTSFNVGVGVSVRLGEGVRARAVVEASERLEAMGQKCLSLEAMLKLHPDLRKLKKTVNCK